MGGPKVLKKDPLLHPQFEDLHTRLQTGTLRFENDPRKWSRTRIPIELRPVIEEQNLSDLVRQVNLYPVLYWHPLVRAQVVMLCKARQATAGLTLGPVSDESAQQLRTRARKLCRDLIGAHARGVLLGDRIEWKSPRAKPGPKGNLADLSPTASNDIPAHQLDRECRELEYSLTILLGKDFNVPKRRDQEYKNNFAAKLTRAVLSASELPAAYASWRALDLMPAVEGFLAWYKRPAKQRHDGRALYLAYCLLSVLTGQSISVIRDKIRNFRYPPTRL